MDPTLSESTWREESRCLRFLSAGMLVDIARRKSVVLAKICPTCGFSLGGSTSVNMCPVDGSLLTPKLADPYVNTVIDGRYRVEKSLGSGGYGGVYQAVHVELGKLLAVKILRSELIQDPAHIKRFQHEAQSAASLDHPNIASVHDYGLLPDGNPYIVMDFVNGRTLSTQDGEDPQPVKEAVEIVMQACNGLAAAHARGIVHRDVKPNNIVVEESDGGKTVKVLDFGLSKTLGNQDGANPTQTGEAIGTPDYMSPEQCQGNPVDHRSDIYSLGLVLYYLLSGRPAVKGRTPYESMQKQLSETPPAPSELRTDADIPPAIENALFKALEKEPAKRFQTMEDFRDALKSALPAIDQPRSGRHFLRINRRHRQRLLFWCGKGLVAAGVVAAFWCTYQLVQPRQYRPEPLTLNLAALEVTPGKIQAMDGERFTAVNLRDASLKPGVAAELSKIKSIEEIDFSNSSVSDRDLALLASLPKLRNLNLAKTDIHGEGLQDLVHLKELNLQMSGISDDGLRCLSGLSALESLDLSYSDVKGSELSAIAGLPKLRKLCLRMAVKGEHQKNLSRLTRITTLDLCDSALDERAIQSLARLPNLRHLILTGCRLSPQQLTFLRQSLTPHCQITCDAQ